MLNADGVHGAGEWIPNEPPSGPYFGCSTPMAFTGPASEGVVSMVTWQVNVLNADGVHGAGEFAAGDAGTGSPGCVLNADGVHGAGELFGDDPVKRQAIRCSTPMAFTGPARRGHA